MTKVDFKVVTYSSLGKNVGNLSDIYLHYAYFYGAQYKMWHE